MIPVVPETWEQLGRWIAIALAAVAVVIGVVGYLSDLLYVRHRKQVIKEARAMLAEMTKTKS